jgi:glutaredoxin
MAKIKVIETDEIPVCPYCEKELSEFHVNTKQSSWSLVERHYVCFCPHCRKVLSIAFARSAF